jgi:hypothetical protein
MLALGSMSKSRSAVASRRVFFYYLPALPARNVAGQRINRATHT